MSTYNDQTDPNHLYTDTYQNNQVKNDNADAIAVSALIASSVVIARKQILNPLLNTTVNSEEPPLPFSILLSGLAGLATFGAYELVKTYRSLNA